MQKTNYLKIQTQGELISLEWLGSIDSIDYRNGHISFLDEIKPQHKKWLLDYKSSANIDMEDRLWTLEEWLPQAFHSITTAIAQIAIVVPENIFNKISVRIFSTQMRMRHPETDIAFFKSKEEASNWLNC
ncbi:MAG: STAS/SEC14 domain-containing protein [Bernardetiaceae bacterium]|nr:STAS/SEC14 domain-containing protein [Bernardetiaceae bacterium]